MVDVAIVAGVLVFIVAGAVSPLLSQGKSYVRLVSWSFLAVAIVYGLLWVNVVTSTFWGLSSFDASSLVANRRYLLLHSVLVVILCCGVIVGWFLTGKYNKQAKRAGGYVFSGRIKQIFFLAWILLIVAVATRWLYVSAYGGFIGYLNYARLVRSGIFNVNNVWSFLKPFGFLAEISSFFFFTCIVSRYRLIRSVIGFVLAFGFSLFNLYAGTGRITFIVYLATFALYGCYILRVRPKIITVIAISSFPVLLLFAYFISNVFHIKGAETFSGYLANETAFPFVSFFAHLGADEYGNRMFIDILFGPFHLLPSSWTDQIFLGADQINTVLIRGAPKGTNGVTGTVPVDLLTFGFMQLGVFGVLITGVLFGWVIRQLESFLASIRNKNLSFILLAFAGLQIGFRSVIYAGGDIFIAALFPLVCMSFLALGVRWAGLLLR